MQSFRSAGFRGVCYTGAELAATNKDIYINSWKMAVRNLRSLQRLSNMTPGNCARLARYYTKNFTEIETEETSFQGAGPGQAGDVSKITQATSNSSTADTNRAGSTGRGFYCLGQFPYPSGNIHLGHFRVYSIADSIYRYEMLRGSKVISPVGWDSFGLPAENAARDRNIHPGTWTEANIQEMKRDLLKTGLVLEFDRELATHSPQYYKWTQWIFLKLLEKGLVYQKESWVNWDPVDHTVLANEQVDSKGMSWRSGAVVERIQMKQWYFKITAYGNQLYDDLNTLSGWPESVKELQRGWIGKSQGHQVSFQVTGLADGQTIKCFTTRFDTLHGVKFVAVHPHHEIISSLSLSSQQLAELEQLKDHVSKSREANLKEGKTCVATLLGECLHPLTQERIPLYAADYVLSDYGTGAVMGVPFYDERDKRLATKVGIDFTGPDDSKLLSPEQLHELVSQGSKNGWVKEGQMFALRDWLISRQRYWGAPIPIIHCDSCGAVPVPEDQLPVLLPELGENTELYSKDAQTGRIRNPLEHPNFRSCRCPKCQKPARRETDTMDTFVDSSWYFMRFLDPKNEQQIFSRQKADAFMPIKAYIGGMEHAIKHLLYARFIYKVFHDMQLVGSVEPFENIITQGLVMGKAFKLKSSGKYLTKEQAAQFPEAELETTVEKMSKSKYNGISPLAAVAAHGKDCVKLAMSLAGPVEKDIVIEDSLMANTSSLLDKIESFILSLDLTKMPEEGNLPGIEKVVREYDAGFQYKRIALHVASARIIEMFNNMKKHSDKLGKNEVRVFLLLLYPFAPHMAEYLWDQTRLAQEAGQRIKDIPEGRLRECFTKAIGTPYTAGYSFTDNPTSAAGAGSLSPWTVVLNNRPVPRKTVPAETATRTGDKEGLKSYLIKEGIIDSAEEIVAVNLNPKKCVLVVNTRGGKPRK